MKVKYIGGESEPGSQSTTVFGIKVRCGEVFDIPPQFERKARGNVAFEVIEEEQGADAGSEAVVTPKPRKKKEQPNA